MQRPRATLAIGALILSPVCALADPVLYAAAGLTYCGGKAIKRQIAFRIDTQPKTGGQWDASITVNGKRVRAMTAFSYFGSTQKPPAGFLVALLGEDRSEVLIFSQGGKSWLEFGDYRYEPCRR